MKTFCLFLVIALVTSGSLGLNLRFRRQSDDKADNKEEGLEDRYGWSQGRFPQGQFPGQGFNPFPWQNSFAGQNQFPGQGPNRFPNQGQQTGQGQFQFPGQGQNQFPNQGQQTGQGQFQFPGQGQNQFPNQGQQSTTQQPSSGTTAISAALQDCIAKCPVTSEFRPVCGSNQVQYSNPGRLICAQMCGVDVQLSRESPCPSATTPSPV